MFITSRQTDKTSGRGFGGKGIPVNHILKKLQNRIKDTKGMSIGETLVATLILLLATSVLVTTISLGASHYVESLAGSEANVLASTIESMMTNELAYTSEIHVSGDQVTFQSRNYARDDSLSAFGVSDGKVVIEYPAAASGSSVKLLGDKSYPHNLSVSNFSISYNSSSYTFTITFSIGTGSTTYLTRTFDVINVNRTAVS